MKKRMLKTLLVLSLLGLLAPAAGCNLRDGSSAYGSLSDALLGFDFLPSGGGFDVVDDRGYDDTEVIDFQVDIQDDFSTDDYYDGGYDSYDGYDDGFDGYGGWKPKRRG